ncbi:uncharacterized protein LOC111048526 [Nilaparvata lugens]|uniref:uncharacterized protein LOC111048526 n=1 Tax=Nilaparvata lugens TaxID=108931 RepID=UPI00193E9CA1|nr:uncharacterized protein LOC111048526 [Nilaparvata lugens]XP_039293944.1 uncharacterized protein LOC111048526 [Nilaparvata lugens]XP_039293945.1 uncharacterized protein LOC111048526 [Nilaparvata lugens]
MNRYFIICVLLLNTLIHYEAIQSAIFDDSWQSDDDKLAALSELPLERLILLKQRLKHAHKNNNSSNRGYHSMNYPFPTRDSDDELTSRKPPMQRTYEDYSDHHHHHHDPPSWKDTKTAKKNVQTIFQTTVTILAFLAFGGYLICLILTTIRGNAQAAAMVVQQSQSSTTTTTTRTKRASGFLVGEGVPLDKAVFALNLIAEGYTKYHRL